MPDTPQTDNSTAVATWQPNAEITNQQPDAALLATLTQLLDGLEQGESLTDRVTADVLEQARRWIELPEPAWRPAIQQLPHETLLPLATFYTLAEMKLPGWQAGAKNPAIWIFRYLKQHRQLPEKSVIKALKNKTDNRFIPYGSVL